MQLMTKLMLHSSMLALGLVFASSPSWARTASVAAHNQVSYGQTGPSAHERAELNCDSCHSKDDNSKRQLALKLSQLTRTDREHLPKDVLMCAQCHDNVVRAFVQSEHFTALVKDSRIVVPTCQTCHGSSDAARADARTVNGLCKTCHNASTGIRTLNPIAADVLLDNLGAVDAALETLNGAPNAKAHEKEITALENRLELLRVSFHRLDLRATTKGTRELMASVVSLKHTIVLSKSR